LTVRAVHNIDQFLTVLWCTTYPFGYWGVIIVFEKIISSHDLFHHRERGGAGLIFIDKLIHAISATIMILNSEIIFMALYKANAGILKF
jgi:hypothetical protein